MRKLLLSASLLVGLLATSALNAQKANSGFYAGIQGGFGLPLAAGTTDYFDGINYNETANSSTSTTYEAKNFSLGKGANVGVNVGYMFNKNIGVELGASYFMGGKDKTFYKNTASNYNKEMTISGKMIQLSPSVVVKGNGVKMIPYAKVGAVLGLGTKVTYTETYNGVNTGEFVRELDGGLPVGFRAALGAEFPVTSNINFFAEISGIGMSYAPKKATATKEIWNGKDYLPSEDYSFIHHEFVDSYTYTGTQPANESSKFIKFTLPFSNVGLNAGINYKF